MDLSDHSFPELLTTLWPHSEVFSAYHGPDLVPRNTTLIAFMGHRHLITEVSTVALATTTLRAELR